VKVLEVASFIFCKKREKQSKLLNLLYNMFSFIVRKLKAHIEVLQRQLICTEHRKLGSVMLVTGEKQTPT
jgi:hypothetical protein